MTELDKVEASARSSSVRVLAWLVLVLLVGQFVMGMITNIYGSIPLVHPGAASGSSGGNVMALGMTSLNWALFHSQSELRVHILIGLVTGLFSLVALTVGLASRRAKTALTCLLGFVFVAGAGIAGIFFLVYADSNAASLVMSLCFLAAFITYSTALAVTRPRSP